MPFFHHDDPLQQVGDRILAETWQQCPGLARNQLALTWVVYDEPVIVNTGGAIAPNDFWQQPVRGFSYRGVECVDAAELVHLVYLVAIHDWLEQSMVTSTPELERAMQDMIVRGSRDAAGLVVDVLTGTTSGPELPPQPLQTWQTQRNIVNRYLQSLQWPELESVTVNQKTWTDLPYGREWQSMAAAQNQGNRLTTDAIARFMHSIIGGIAASPGRSQAMMALLQQSVPPPPAVGSGPTSPSLRSALPASAASWHLQGQNKQGQYEVLYAEVAGIQPFLVALFAQPSSAQTQAPDYPAHYIGRRIIEALTAMAQP